MLLCPLTTKACINSSTKWILFYLHVKIVREVENDGGNLNKLMQDYPELESDCLPRALLAAVKRDNHSNVCKLVALGATNIDEALKLAKMEGKHRARAMLLLLIAAMNNDCNLVRRLFGEPLFNLGGEALSDEGFGEVQAVVKRGKVSTSVPIEIAHSWQHRSVI